jgi:hypothetical protein
LGRGPAVGGIEPATASLPGLAGCKAGVRAVDGSLRVRAAVFAVFGIPQAHGRVARVLAAPVGGELREFW